MQTLISRDTATPAANSFKVVNIGAGEARHDLSREWIARPHDERFLSLNDIAAHTRKRYQGAKELRLENKQIEVIAPDSDDANDLNRLWVEGDGLGRTAFTNWSFGQLAQLAGAPSAYLRQLPSPIAADCLNYGLWHNRETEAVKLFASDDQMRAVTGPDYGRIPDFEVVKAVQQIAGNGTGDTRWKVPGSMDWRTMIYDADSPITKDSTTLYASDRDLFLFLVDDRNPIEVGTVNGQPDLMFRGFYVKNSEVGSSALTIAAFYMRAVCCNRIMWGVEGFEEVKIRHSRLAPSRFIETARPALTSFADGSVKKLVEGVQRAKDAIVAKDKDSALEWLQARKLSRARALKVLDTVEREEGHRASSVWDMAQGITAIAREIPHTDERTALELEARTILDKVAA